MGLGLKSVLSLDQDGEIPTNDRPFDFLAIGRHGVCAFLAFLQAVEEMLVGLACVLDGLLWRAFGDF